MFLVSNVDEFNIKRQNLIKQSTSLSIERDYHIGHDPLGEGKPNLIFI